MAKFALAITHTLKNEGGYISDADDSGGVTNWGISLAFYRKKIKVDATKEDIRNLSVAEAENIYEEYFWNRPNIGALHNQQLANKVFDLHVNTGRGIALLQKAVNTVNPKAHLVTDNILGIKTVEMANAVDQDILYRELISQALSLYERIASHGNNHKYLQGWKNRLLA